MQVNTDENTLIAKIVGLVIALVVVGMVLVPFVTDATTTEKTFTNVGAYELTNNDDNYTLIYDPSGKYVVNGEDIAFNSLPTDRLTLVSTTEFFIRMANLGIQDIWIIGNGISTKIADTTSEAPVTMTFNDGTLTIGETTYTYTSESFRGIATSGEYVRTINSDPAKINHDTTIIVGDGLTVVTAWNNRFYIYGTADDLTVTPPTGITVSDLAVNTTAVNGYKNLVELNSITFVASDGDEHTVNATYTNVIVPKMITAELAQHASNIEVTLYQMIPILIVLGLVVAIVGMFAYNKHGN